MKPVGTRMLAPDMYEIRFVIRRDYTLFLHAAH